MTFKPFLFAFFNSSLFSINSHSHVNIKVSRLYFSCFFFKHRSLGFDYQIFEVLVLGMMAVLDLA